MASFYSSSISNQFLWSCRSCSTEKHGITCIGGWSNHPQYLMLKLLLFTALALEVSGAQQAADRTQNDCNSPASHRTLFEMPSTSTLDTHGPDILGHCSTLLRDTPYVQSVRAGSTIDGYDRTRILGNLRVRLVDIDHEQDVGYIAIAEDKEGFGGRLSRKKVYRCFFFSPWNNSLWEKY